MAAEKRETWQHVAQVTLAYREAAGDLRALQGCIDALRPLVTLLPEKDGPRDVTESLSDALLRMRDAMDAEGASLLVLDEDTQELVFILAHGDVSPEELAWRRIPFGQGVAGWVAKHRRAATVNNVANDERFFAGVDREFDHTTRSIVAAPIGVDDRILGVVEFINKKDGKLFVLRDETLTCLFAKLAGELLGEMEESPEGASDALASSTDGPPAPTDAD